MRCVGSRWVYKLKRDEQNVPVRFKSRLVAKGYTQREGVDYTATSAPVISKEAVRVFLATAAARGWVVEQFDVSTAYLYAPLDADIYMEVPEGFIDLWANRLSADDLDLLQSGRGVLKVKKSIYGLKQAGRCWHHTIKSFFIEECGLQPTAVEPCLFVGNDTTVPLYVDDGMVGAPSVAVLEEFFGKFSARFDVKRMGFPRHFLGWSIVKGSDGSITIHQQGYIEKLNSTYGNGGRPKATPMTADALVDSSPGSPDDSTAYRGIIGSMMFAAVGTRPDIATVTSILSRHMEAPNKAHLATARNAIGYLAATSGLGIQYRSHTGAPHIEVYTDASYASSEVGAQRKSRSGWIVLVNGSPVAWKSGLQPILAHSTAEAEYIALSDGAKEAVYIKRVLEAMLGDIEGPIVAHEDNQTAKYMAEEVSTKRSKHIDIRYHHVRQLVEDGAIVVRDCRSSDMIADFFTKPLAKELFIKFRNSFMVEP